MAAVTICSDFGAPQNKVWPCFHCFPIYFPWSDGTRCHDLSFLCFVFFIYIFLFLLYFILQYCIGFAIHWHESATGVHEFPILNPSSHLAPHIISLDHLRAPAPSILYPVLNIDWWFVSYMIVYMFQCHSPKSSHPFPLPQSPKSVLYICVSFAVSHTGLSLASF